MESQQPAVVEPQPKKQCNKPCCQCKPVRILRNNCLAQNPEEKCIDFVNAYKNCIEAKKMEMAMMK